MKMILVSVVVGVRVLVPETVFHLVSPLSKDHEFVHNQYTQSERGVLYSASADHTY